MKWALVTGGAKTLGSALSLRLAEMGFSIVVHYRNSFEEAEKVAELCRQKGVQAQTIQCDFSSKESLKDFSELCVKRYPDLSVLVNNVGTYLIASALETLDHEWADIFQTNLNVPFILSKALVPALRRQQGSIINIGVFGVQDTIASTYATAYMIAKQGLWMLTKSLAKELAFDHMKVNMISPGHLEHSVDLSFDEDRIPMKRPCTCHEIANVMEFLLNSENSYITGQNLDIAGGLRL